MQSCFLSALSKAEILFYYNGPSCDEGAHMSSSESLSISLREAQKEHLAQLLEDGLVSCFRYREAP